MPKLTKWDFLSDFQNTEIATWNFQNILFLNEMPKLKLATLAFFIKGHAIEAHRKKKLSQDR